MAHQPTKSRKFLAGTVTAALVATAIVPTASAADFEDIKGNTHEDAINALIDLGVINGYPDGTFQPNKTLSRSDVVKMMGKWLVTLGYDIPTDYASVQRFDDVSLTGNEELLKYAALVKDQGVFNGNAGNLEPTGAITRENMALVLVRAFDEINGTDLVAHVEGEEFENEVTDLNSAKAEARPYINVLDFYDITTVANFNPKATTTRGQFATFLYTTSKVEAPVASVEVKSVSAIDVNKVEVKFNTAVDTDKAVVTLTKGLANYNVTAKWNEAKDAVVLTSVLSKLSPADYTVKVEGLTDEVLTANVKVEAEVASSVVVNTTQNDVVANTETVNVYLNVLNQYGTKFTVADSADLTVTASESIADVSFGTVTEAGNGNSKGNLKASFVVTDTNGKLKAGDSFKVTAVYKGLTSGGTVTFVNPIQLSELSFGQVLPLKDTPRITVGDDDLVVPYTAINQYGEAYEIDLSENITWVSSNSAVVDAATLAVNADGELTVDAGTTAGTAVLTAILADGTTSQFSVTVAAEAYANTVSLNGPTTLVADGETASLDLVVQDQFGEIIKNKDVSGLTFSNGFAINTKTGKLEGTVTENSAFKVTVTRNSDSKELAASTFAVEAAAEANTITAVNFNTLYEVGAKKAISVNNVEVKDQYGRALTPSSVTLTEVDATNDNFSLSGTEVTALVAGTKVYTVAVNGSTSAVKNITLTAVATTAVTSYELAPIGTIYNDGAVYAATPTLVGKTSDGKTVVLEAGKIDSLTSSNTNVAVINGVTVEGNGAFTSSTDGTSTIKAWSTNGTLLGSAVVTVTNTNPTLTTIEAADLTIDNTATLADVFTSEDQYGVAFDEAGTWYITDDANVTSSYSTSTLTLNNGADDALTLDGTYTVKFVSTNGAVVETTSITVTP